MTLLQRSIIKSEGYIGGPGYNILHWSLGTWTEFDLQDAANEFNGQLYDMLDGMADALVAGVTFKVSPDVIRFEVTTGEAVGVITQDVPEATITGTDSGQSIDRAACAVASFGTDEWVNGRRLRGRAYVGPLGSGAFSAGGQIVAGIQEGLPDLFAACITGTGSRLAVWHRPTPALPSSGSYGDCVSVSCSATPGTLRSRKT